MKNKKTNATKTNASKSRAAITAYRAGGLDQLGSYSGINRFEPQEKPEQDVDDL